MKCYKIDVKVGSYRTEVWTHGYSEDDAIKNAVQYIRDSFGIKTAYTVYSVENIQQIKVTF